MRALLRWLWPLLFAATFFPSVATAGDRHEDAARILFPYPDGWIQFSKLPPVTNEEWNQLVTKLQDTLNQPKVAANSLFSGGGCNWFERASEQTHRTNFRTVDINGDGRADIVYSGSALCSEGDVTVIWMNAGGAYENTRPAAWPMKLLWISSGKGDVLSVATGCCGDPVDAYFHGSLQNFRQYGSLRITQETELPKSVSGSRKKFKAKNLVLVRETASEKNTYDLQRSEFVGHATFGNILRKYMTGVKGEVISSVRFGPQRWSFVVIDPAQDRLASEVPYSINAGWVLNLEY